MNRQFENNITFFDIGFDNPELQFATLYSVMSETYKKRGNITKLVLRYLKDKASLSLEEQKLALSIIDDSFYNKPKPYSHCKICSTSFQRDVLYKMSQKLKYWDICIPTVHYFPGNLMIYLKDREISHKENFQDLNLDELKELEFIVKHLIYKLNEKIFYGKLLGVNVLFNQISKSQLCIHGHIELMIKDIDKLNLGCKLLLDRFYDPITEYINKDFFNNDGIIKTIEGIRIDASKLDLKDVLNMVRQYEFRLNLLIKKTQQLRLNKICPEDLNGILLYNGLSPAPANSVYYTDYRGKIFVSSVPELVPPIIKLDDINDLDNEEDMYLIKYNATTPNRDYSIMKKYSPTARPSSKISSVNESTPYVRKLTREIKKVLEE